MSPKESWTLDSLWAKLRDLKETARKQAERLSINNGRIMQLDKRASLVRDPKARELAKIEVRKLAGSQSGIASRIRLFSDMWKRLMKTVTEFLSKLRVKVPGGLGEPITIVSATVIAAVLVAIAFIVKVKFDNDRMDKLIQERGAIIEGMVSGQITPEAARQMVDQLNQSSPAGQQDALGVSNVLGSAAPIALAVAAIVVVPMLFKSRG